MGGFIQTDGIEYKSGAYIHIHSQEGELTYRAIRQEFQEKPKETMEAFLEALSELMPNHGQENSTEEPYQFHFPECSLKGCPEHIGIYEKNKTETPILEYHITEWQENPEEVIGALLNCLEIESLSTDANPWENLENSEDL
jgi:hypothetical protein